VPLCRSSPGTAWEGSVAAESSPCSLLHPRLTSLLPLRCATPTPHNIATYQNQYHPTRLENMRQHWLSVCMYKLNTFMWPVGSRVPLSTAAASGFVFVCLFVSDSDPIRIIETWYITEYIPYNLAYSLRKREMSLHSVRFCTRSESLIAVTGKWRRVVWKTGALHESTRRYIPEDSNIFICISRGSDSEQNYKSWNYK
jgi:hypothetical protein